MKLVYVSGTGGGNELETKNKIKSMVFPAQEVFQLTSEQEFIKRGIHFMTEVLR
jgi:hypothetical protein